MSKEKEQKGLTEAELRAKIEAEVRAEFEAKAQAEKKVAEEAEKKAAELEAKAEKELAKQEKTMKAILEAEKKVHIHIPENPANPNEVVPVGINGVIYAIPTGQDFEVPESIYKVWKNAWDQTKAANKRMDDVLKKEIQIM